MRTRDALLTMAVVPIVAVMVVTCAPKPDVRKGGAETRFAPESSPAIDFAKLEREVPFSIDELEALIPQRFAGFTQEQVDQIYGRLTAGPIPDGNYDGDLFFPRGSNGGTRLGEVLGGRLTSWIGNLAVRNAELFARMLWKGKVFSRQGRLVRTRIEDFAPFAPLMGGDTRGIERITVAGRDALLLFPARLYCGQSLLDGRRESIVMDYAFTDELPGYREQPDELAGRNGLRIRDEIRMIRPGFYLGRAYMNRVFAVNFTLINNDAVSAGATSFRMGTVQQDCWTGTQKIGRR
jgi:hypothetical protein